MSRTKITILGKLSFSDDGGLQYSVLLTHPPNVAVRGVVDYLTRVYAPASMNPSELIVGDFLVHVDHGVCRYTGLKHFKLTSGEGDYLRLEFAGGEPLYLPVDLMDRVSKYRGRGGRLGKLGQKYPRPTTPTTPTTYRLEALPNAYAWPGVGAFPDFSTPADSDFADLRAWRARQEEWLRSCDAYMQALHADPSYRQAAKEFLEQQRREPQPLRDQCWAYRDNVLGLESTEPEGLRDRETDILLVKHHVFRRERQYERVRREVEALENLEKLEGVVREPIAESVRLFVWQRDKGQCVKCDSHERLEFNHIIPVIAGGSSTERNIQLLCESCNRSKGSTI
ncbi:MAG: CarD family transcriptional regulator [Candidatus Binatia bacterium]